MFLWKADPSVQTVTSSEFGYWDHRSVSPRSFSDGSTSPPHIEAEQSYEGGKASSVGAITARERELLAERGFIIPVDAGMLTR